MFSPDIFLEKIDGGEGTLFPCPKIKMEIKRFLFGLGSFDMFAEGFAENKQSQEKQLRPKKYIVTHFRRICTTSEDPSARPQEKSGSLIYRHTCLMNHQKTRLTSLMAPWDPLATPWVPSDP